MAKVRPMTDVDFMPSDMMASFTVRVRVRVRGAGTRRWRVRLAAEIFALGAWIAGTDLDIDLLNPSDQ